MLRMAGGVMLCVVSSVVGFKMSVALKRRVDFLVEFIHSLNIIKSNIEFGGYDLIHIFKRLQSPFFELCVREHTSGLRRAWDDATDSVATEHGLKAEDVAIIKRLGESLGKSDIEGQINCIDVTIKELQSVCEDAKGEYSRLSKVYRGCGVLFGVFILIILM